MIMKMFAVTAFTLSLAGGAFAQTAPAAATDMPATTSECPQGKAAGIDNTACQDIKTTTPMAPAAPMDPAAAMDPAMSSDAAKDAMSKCPDGKASGIDNKACADIK